MSLLWKSLCKKNISTRCSVVKMNFEKLKEWLWKEKTFLLFIASFYLGSLFGTWYYSTFYTLPELSKCLDKCLLAPDEGDVICHYLGYDGGIKFGDGRVECLNMTTGNWTRIGKWKFEWEVEKK